MTDNKTQQNSTSFSDQYQRVAMRTSRITMAGNLFLSLFKLLAGIFANSQAMISDAVHSASDVLSTIIVMVGIKISGKNPDSEHPYGHERIECVASVILAMFLGIIGVGIGYTGVTSIISKSYLTAKTPGILALIAAVISIAAKEWMYQYTRHVSKKINSPALMADAWHHRSDALSSIGSLIGIAGARLGVPVLDPAASIVICIFVVKAAVDIFRDAVNKMVDHACDEEFVEKVRESVLGVDGVLGIDRIDTRQFGARSYVDLEILADGSIDLTEAHAIAEKVHDKIENSFPEVKHCMVHVNPKDI